MTDRPLRHYIHPFPEGWKNGQSSGVATAGEAIFNLGPDGDGDSAPQDRIVEDLAAACLTGAYEAPSVLLQNIIADGYSPQFVSEHLIPEASRRVGIQWCEDELAFAQVTIACARLVRVLREAEEMEPSTVDPFCAPQALVIVVEGAQHTMGGTVLAGMLRRRGIDARLVLDTAPAMAARLVQQNAFDCVLISASYGDPLETLRRIASGILTSSPHIRLAIGGTIIADIGNADEVARLTGVSVVANDLDDVLKTFGIRAAQPAQRQAQTYQMDRVSDLRPRSRTGSPQ